MSREASASLRLFFAFECTCAVLHEVATALQSWNISLPASFHLTLKFLGNVPGRNVASVIERCRKVSFDPITVSAGQFGVFPSEERVQVAWLGITPDVQVRRVQQQLSQLLPEYKDEYTFHPHITLARVRAHPGKENLDAFLAKESPAISWTWKEMGLYKSELTSAGAKYSLIEPKVFK